MVSEQTCVRTTNGVSTNKLDELDHFHCLRRATVAFSGQGHFSQSDHKSTAEQNSDRDDSATNDFSIIFSIVVTIHCLPIAEIQLFRAGSRCPKPKMVINMVN